MGKREKFEFTYITFTYRSFQPGDKEVQTPLPSLTPRIQEHCPYFHSQPRAQESRSPAPPGHRPRRQGRQCPHTSEAQYPRPSSLTKR